MIASTLLQPGWLDRVGAREVHPFEVVAAPELLLSRSLPRSPEGTHTKVCKEQRKNGCKPYLSGGRRAGKMPVIFADGSCRAKKRQREEEQTCNLQPQDVEDTADAPQSYAAGPVERPHPAIFAGFSAGDPQDGAPLSAEIASWQNVTSFSTHFNSRRKHLFPVDRRQTWQNSHCDHSIQLVQMRVPGGSASLRV